MKRKSLAVMTSLERQVHGRQPSNLFLAPLAAGVRWQKRWPMYRDVCQQLRDEQR